MAPSNRRQNKRGLELLLQRPLPSSRPDALAAQLRILTALSLTDFPWLSTYQIGEISRAVYSSQDRHGIILEEIDDSVTSDDQFAKIRTIEFGDDTTKVRAV